MTNSHETIAIFPWLNIKSSISVLDVVFVPFLDVSGNISDPIKPISEKINFVFKSLHTLANDQRKNCTIAFILNKGELGWKLANDDFLKVKKAALFLYLATLAKNEYFQQLRAYTNSSYFRYFFQNLPTENSDHVSFEVKRRGGGILVGGIKASEAVISAPLQCYEEGPSKIDENLIHALNKANEERKEVLNLIFLSLNYFSMSHTDDDFMDDLPEITFMASAFEALLKTDQAYELSKRIGELFAPYGNIKVGNTLNVRSGIKIDSKYENDQKEWFLHRKWIEEIHNLRSKLIHAEPTNVREWGWLRYEHLIMGAFIYPLVVKLILQRETFYTMTHKDETHCLAVDRLLGAKGWHETEKGIGSKWTDIIFQAYLETSIARRMKELETN